MSVNAISGSNYHDYANIGQNVEKAVLQDQGNYGEKVDEDHYQDDVVFVVRQNPNVSLRPVSELDRLNEAVDYLNGKLEFTQTKCEVTYHKDIRRYAVKVRDKNTDEIIREIPPEKTINMIKKVWEFAGFIIDEKR